jgi:hypothetical protein
MRVVSDVRISDPKVGKRVGQAVQASVCESGDSPIAVIAQDIVLENGARLEKGRMYAIVADGLHAHLNMEFQFKEELVGGTLYIFYEAK